MLETTHNTQEKPVEKIAPRSGRPRAIALMSGGLDSTLATKIIKDQGVEVIGLHLLSPFGCREDVAGVAATLGVRLIIREKGEAYLDLVQNPRYGYGRHMNPCIDCRIFMFQLAEVVMDQEEADFVITGEVLGQRPMSQQRNSMELIDRRSPLEDRLLRPLSAHCFAPMIAERNGWVDREALFHISGRGRKIQIEMAQQMGLKEYSAPGGGCLLTEAGFAPKLKDFFQHPTFHSPEERLAQSELLAHGRHFRISPQTKVVVGRDQTDNQTITRLFEKSKGMLFNSLTFDGPTALALGGPVTEPEKKLIGEILTRYGKSKDCLQKEIGFESASGSGRFFVERPISETELDGFRLK